MALLGDASQNEDAQLIVGTAAIAVKHLTSVVSGCAAAVMSGQLRWVGEAEESRKAEFVTCVVHGNNFWVWWQKSSVSNSSSTEECR